MDRESFAGVEKLDQEPGRRAHGVDDFAAGHFDRGLPDEISNKRDLAVRLDGAQPLIGAAAGGRIDGRRDRAHPVFREDVIDRLRLAPEGFEEGAAAIEAVDAVGWQEQRCQECVIHRGDLV